MAKTKYTIKEIAQMAGVSRATVDRVIHGRGIVSEDTAKQIQSILDKIDYRPNVLAQTLKKGELVKLAILMPDPSFDVYWERAVQGIDEAQAEYSYIGIHIDTFLFNPYKSASFTLNSKHILKGAYDGIIVAPFYYRESMEFFKQCDKAKIPYVTFNTHIKESNPLCFVGQNLIESGRTAASLLDMKCAESDKVIILHLDEDSANAKHMQEKEEGFIGYFKDKGFPNDKVSVEKIDKISQIDQQMGKILKSTKAKGIFLTTSKVHYIADYIKEYNLDIKLMGYDFIDENISYLESGIINFLIYQNPKLQASQALTLLVDHLAFKKEIPKSKILPPEIVIKENLESYLIEFRGN